MPDFILYISKSLFAFDENNFQLIASLYVAGGGPENREPNESDIFITPNVHRRPH